MGRQSTAPRPSVQSPVLAGRRVTRPGGTMAVWEGNGTIRLPVSGTGSAQKRHCKRYLARGHPRGHAAGPRPYERASPSRGRTRCADGFDLRLRRSIVFPNPRGSGTWPPRGRRERPLADTRHPRTVSERPPRFPLAPARPREFLGFSGVMVRARRRIISCFLFGPCGREASASLAASHKLGRAVALADPGGSVCAHQTHCLPSSNLRFPSPIGRRI